ncbi:O-antigen ligase family protein [Megasphaera stantonii]|uniref:O-antigen ligase family protein n=1 Tax=Megasphaera stantonii TaxID=2144175 RepID=UPI0019585F26|nr:O-antigen ligase family protein [Megasphaera stantonii]MBM6732311.1 O-antigen ligase family protein [Megasphaera stantonii]
MTKVVPFLICLYIFFLCSTISNAGYSISLSLLLIFAMVEIVKKKIKIKIPPFSFDIIYLAFFGLLIIAAVGSGEKEAIESTLQFFYYTIPFIFLYLVFQYRFCERALQVGIFSAAVVLIGFSAYQFITLPIGTRISSIFVSPNRLPMVLEVFFPFMGSFLFMYYKRENRNFIVFIGMGVVLLLTVIALLLTQSRGGIIGIAFGFLFLLIVRFSFLQTSGGKLKKGFIFLSTIIFISGIGGWATQNILQRSYDMERILLLKSSYEMWSDHKLYGVGFDRWDEEYQEKYISPVAKEKKLDMPHNTVAFFFSATGSVGGIGYLLFIFGTIIILVKKMIDYPENMYLQAMLWAFIAMFAHGLVDAGITNKFAARLLFGFLGITMASLRINSHDSMQR